MEIRNLYSFLRVAELGSFTQAAADLGYAQSTITAQIRQLESDIGVPLFERIGKKNVLTENGERLMHYANQIIRIEEGMKSIGKPEGKDTVGTLRIGIVESIMHSLLLSVIGELHASFPKVVIQIKLAVTASLFEMLRRNEVDIAFTMGEMAHVRDCVCACSHPETAVFLAGANHALAKEIQIPVADIFDYSMIVIGDATYLQKELNKLAHRCDKEIRSYIQTKSSGVILDLIEQGLGIGFLPKYLADVAMKKKQIAILPVTGYKLEFFMHGFYHKNKWVTPQMEGLLRLVKRYWEKRDSETGQNDLSMS